MPVTPPTVTAPAILFVASDGIHDNFKFDVLSNTLGDLWGQKTPPAAGDASPAVNPDGIHQGTDNTTLALANAFMEVNKREAYKNFGNSADNMSLVVCTIYPAAV